MKIRREDKHTQQGWQPFLHLLKETKPPKWMLSLALCISIATTVIGLVIPLFTKRLVDGFSLTSLHRSQVVLLVGAFLLQALGSGLSIYLLNYVGQHTVARLRDRLWKKLLALPLPYYDTHTTGETISRMTNDTSVVKALITEHLSNLVTGVISIIGSIAILLYMDWQMTVLMLIAVPMSLAILMPLGRAMFRISKGLQDETASFTSILTQVLSEVRLVKSSGSEPLEYERGSGGIYTLFRFGLKEARVQAMIGPLMYLILMALLVIIMGYGGVQVSSGRLTAGDLVAFILYLFQIVMPMTQFTQFFTHLHKARGATERMITMLQHDEEDHHQGKPVDNQEASITLDHVTFGYENGEEVLHDISFAIASGEVTAIVGPSGGGKTTLFSLIERFYQPKSGVIRLADTSIDDFSLTSWRRQIGYVSQESPLMQGTIRENICYGSGEGVSDEALHRAAKMAYADEFIHQLQNGYDTEVGERGVKLSGGQRQRIAIARALLRDPKILMLDEATSSLDSKSEIVVQQALSNLMAGRTTLVIAHRLSTVIDANQIVFIEKGQVTGLGTHQKLFEEHPLYREFAQQQLRISVDETDG